MTHLLCKIDKLLRQPTLSHLEVEQRAAKQTDAAEDALHKPLTATLRGFAQRLVRLAPACYIVPPMVTVVERPERKPKRNANGAHLSRRDNVVPAEGQVTVAGRALTVLFGIIGIER